MYKINNSGLCILPRRGDADLSNFRVEELLSKVLKMVESIYDKLKVKNEDISKMVSW